MQSNNQKWILSIIPWIVPVLLIILWQALCVVGIIPVNILPAPTDVFIQGIQLISSGELVDNLSVSLYRALLGFLIGGIAGFLCGIFNGLIKTMDKLFDTSIQMIRNIPHLALIPLVILWFGIGETAKVFLVALGVLFPVYVNTYHGIKSVDKGLIEMGKIYGLNNLKLFTQIIFPKALPSILVGIRYALGVMWTTLIVAETIAANSGIGYMSMNAREFMQMDVIVLSILIYAILGKLSDSIAKLFEKRFLRWSDVRF